ncbi:protease inhibitor Inh/omp19 family protein [Pseudomonas asplenii]|uniref:protease inhibitor Inh/omp19 family protein n=1 Tax=Pseudomonas asplenii TaxID=53407 RepID=UPI00035E95F3|nr:protease inhibitor Inh/omp19 family protein [Pseudomonas fuscovaginae]
MARSLILPSPETLAGDWQLYPQEDRAGACELQLSAQAPALAGDLDCAAAWLGQRPTRWEPTPDGIWFYGAEGVGIVHLNRQEEGLYEARLQDGRTLVLLRKSQ